MEEASDMAAANTKCIAINHNPDPNDDPRYNSFVERVATPHRAYQ